jgi:hypothetical protein
MSPGVFSRVFGSSLNTVFKRFGVTLFKTLLIYLISLLFVELPLFWKLLMTMGKTDEKSRKQKRIRSKLIDSSDPSSPYRAFEVLNELQSIPDDQVQTLADIPDYCLQHYLDRQTLGIREILDVQDEKQPNGKVFKKVRFFIFLLLNVNFILEFSLFWVNINLHHIKKHLIVSKRLVEVYYPLVLNQVIEY